MSDIGLDAHEVGQSWPAASEWVQRWTHLAKPRGTVLDVACGNGRHMAWFASLGFSVTGIDHSALALAQARVFGTVIQADLENAAWPLLQNGVAQKFDLVLVTNYLWRPLFEVLLQSLQNGGLLIYETFAQGHERYGKPSRPEFLLRPGELLQTLAALHIVAFENVWLDAPARYVQRIAALALPPDDAAAALKRDGFAR